MSASSKAKVPTLEEIKKLAHNDTEFKQRLKQHAVSDANHDLGNSFSDIYKSYKDIGTPEDKYDAPVLHDGWSVVKKFIQGERGEPIDDPKKEWSPTIKGKPHSFKTKGPASFDYSVDVIEVSTNPLPDSVSFFEQITEKNNLYLIYDFAGGKFRNILEQTEKKLKTGEKAPHKKTVIYVMNREVISDPAPKPNYKDPYYQSNKNDLRKVHTRFALDTNKDIVKYPNWDQYPRMNATWDFFSKFDLQLTPVYYNDSSSTVLTFSLSGDPTSVHSSTISTTQEGKLANSRKAMMTFLDKLKAFFTTGKKPENKNINTYCVSLQKKRSGDTLMVLSFFDKKRTYAYDENTITFEQIEETGEIFILTHDTFNTLPISLANGANVLYCGVEQKGKQRFYVFRRLTEPPDYTAIFYEKLKDEENQTIFREYIDVTKKIFIQNQGYLLRLAKHSLLLALTGVQTLERIQLGDKGEPPTFPFTTRDILTGKETVIRSRPGYNVYLKKATEDFNKLFRNIYFDLYRLALYLNTYKPSIPFGQMLIYLNEIIESKSLEGEEKTTDKITLREKTERLRIAHSLLLTKKYQEIIQKIFSEKEYEEYMKKLQREEGWAKGEVGVNYEAERAKNPKTEYTEFEKQVKDSEIIEFGINKFDFVQDYKLFTLERKNNRILFGTVPIIAEVLGTIRQTRELLMEFLNYLRKIQELSVFKASTMKSSFELWRQIIDMGDIDDEIDQHETVPAEGEEKKVEEEYDFTDNSEAEGSEDDTDNNDDNEANDNEDSEDNDNTENNDKNSNYQEVALSEAEYDDLYGELLEEENSNKVSYLVTKVVQGENEEETLALQLKAHQTIFSQLSKTILEEVVGVPYKQGIYRSGTSGNASNPYHLLLKVSFKKQLEAYSGFILKYIKYSDMLSTIEDNLLDQGMTEEQIKKLKGQRSYARRMLKEVQTELKKEARALKKQAGEEKKEEEKKEGGQSGGDPSTLVLDDLYFAQFLCLNTLILLSRYPDNVKPEEMDDMNSLLPFVGSILFQQYKTISISPHFTFLLFTIQMLYYSEHTDLFVQQFSPILRGSPQLIYLPSLFYELFSLTYRGNLLTILKKCAKYYPRLQTLFVIPSIAPQSIQPIETVQKQMLTLFLELDDTIYKTVYKREINLVQKFMAVFEKAKKNSYTKTLKQINEPYQMEQAMPRYIEVMQTAGKRTTRRKNRSSGRRKQTRRKYNNIA